MLAPDILLIEDNHALAALYAELLRDGGYTVERAGTAKLGLERMWQAPPRLVLLDVHLPDRSGFDVLRDLQRGGVKQSVAMLTGDARLDLAVEAMRLGARDFIEKPRDIAELCPRVQRLLGDMPEAGAPAQNDTPAQQAIWGESDAIEAARAQIKTASACDLPVFISGEAGSGKALFARAVHEASRFGGKALVTLPCAALREDQIEQELLGVARGGTSANQRQQVGALERARGGTLYLDDVCALPLTAQAHLAAVLKQAEYRPYGQESSLPLDCRIVASADCNADEARAAGKLSPALHAQLQVLRIQAPPLRACGDDVLAIATRLLQSYSNRSGKQFDGFEASASQWLARHPWPGNVRQMQNLLRACVAVCDGPWMRLEDLAYPQHTGADKAPPRIINIRPPSPPRPLWKTEREAIEAAIEYCEGSVPQAAALLEISASTVYRKIKEWQQLELTANCD